jgi:hypothetical protein
MKIRSSAIAAVLFLSAPGVAFAPIKNAHKVSFTRLFADEKAVRQELEEKAALVDAKDEISYRSNGEEKLSMSSLKISKEAKKKIERATKPRAYPLFLAEKGAIILEDTIASFSKKHSATPTGEQKERIVILGTGWGSAAFLKEIDTNMYDVTVISPRNFFLFTPMLAGASVGTVEYRSITESVREVSEDCAVYFDKELHV